MATGFIIYLVALLRMTFSFLYTAYSLTHNFNISIIVFLGIAAFGICQKNIPCRINTLELLITRQLMSPLV